MKAFLIYIDEYLGSKKVQMMDAHEERGYFRLILAEAASEDCSLPDDDVQLAVFSMLEEQWNKPTKERLKRVLGMTSGKKIRACFTYRPAGAIDGRLYNERLYKEYMTFRARSESGKKGGRPTKQSESEYETEPKANGKQTGSETLTRGNEGESESSSVGFVFSPEEVQEKPNGGVLAVVEDLWKTYISAFLAGGKLLNDRDLEKALSIWLGMTEEDQHKAISDIQPKVIGRHERHIPLPFNHLNDTPWTRRGPGRVIAPPTKASASEDATTEAIRMYHAEKAGKS